MDNVEGCRRLPHSITPALRGWFRFFMHLVVTFFPATVNKRLETWLRQRGLR